MWLNCNNGLNYNSRVLMKEMRRLENSQINMANNCIKIYLIRDGEKRGDVVVVS